jgi:hypothetical protein
MADMSKLISYHLIDYRKGEWTLMDNQKRYYDGIIFRQTEILVEAAKALLQAWNERTRVGRIHSQMEISSSARERSLPKWRGTIGERRR